MKQLKYSRQRESIKACLMARHDHPTADAIYASIREEFPNISLGTVYRNLNLLANEGRITRMAFPVERYDGNTEPHCHFRCDKCGGVYDLDLPYCRELDAKADGASEHQIEGHELLFHGCCARCRAAEDLAKTS